MRNTKRNKNIFTLSYLSNLCTSKDQKQIIIFAKDENANASLLLLLNITHK